MKKFLLVPILAATLALPLIGNEELAQTEPVQAEQIASPEQKLIDEVLADYRAGHYSSFLKKSDDAYQEAEKKWKNNALLEQRKKLSTMVHDYGIDKTDDFKLKIAALHEAQDRELIEICLSHPNEKISREVRDMVFFSPSKQEEESIEFIHSLSLKFKGDGSTPIENKLINIDTEFWLKSLSLEIAKTQSKMDEETFQKQHLVLQLEKIRQMSEACQGDLVDVKIKSYVETASTTLPKVYASASTRKHLTALGRGKIAPQSPTEQELQAVMAKYLQKEEALTEKFFPTNGS
ncbi:MAG: hypothetical protein KFB93_00720 [Simkaniaceae bacterium]|jgi:hypothetical protein|nr:MAG: hypothetical protein KFB93_00720 [Simkaniaceae bacterium]